jgi:hypothetical protein
MRHQHTTDLNEQKISNEDATLVHVVRMPFLIL